MVAGITRAQHSNRRGQVVFQIELEERRSGTFGHAHRGHPCVMHAGDACTHGEASDHDARVPTVSSRLRSIPALPYCWGTGIPGNQTPPGLPCRGIRASVRLGGVLPPDAIVPPEGILPGCNSGQSQKRPTASGGQGARADSPGRPQGPSWRETNESAFETFPLWAPMRV